MAYPKSVVAGIYSSRADMERAYEALRGAGFDSAHISVIYPENLDSPRVAQAKSDNTQAGAVVGGGTGVAVGGTLGLLAGLVALAIPGVGTFLIVGPVISALAGAGIGGVVGEVAGALVGMGVTETEAKHYERRLKSGDLLLAVHSETAESLQQAEKLMRQSPVQDIIVGEQNNLSMLGEMLANEDLPSHS